MIFPIIIVDNFFSEPNKVKDFSKNLVYEKDFEGRWPGERSEPIHEVNFNLFNYFHLKILSILYPNDYENMSYTASCNFQRISKDRHPHEGWVHKDAGEITAIVYLSEHENCGTSLWKPKDFYTQNLSAEKKHHYFKKDYFDKDQLKHIKEHNDKYTKVLEVPSFYNRLLLFDSNHHHSASNFIDQNVREDRLTLITFIDNINLPNSAAKYPITESRRLD